MRKQITILALGALLLATSAVAQDTATWDRWAKATGDALARFLPNAKPFGMTVDPYPPFSGAANETYTYKGADSMVHRYPSYIVHQTWWYDDAELARQTADFQREQEAFKQGAQKRLEEFNRVHGADMKAWDKSQREQMDNLQKQGAPLLQQGKYEEYGKLMEKYKPSVYPPYKELTDSLNKRQDEMTERGRKLENRRRHVSFQIHTNRTPTTTAPAFMGMKPAGTLAGHLFYRQLRGNWDMGGWTETLVDVAVFVGPPGYENPKVKIGHRELTTKSIVVWAWIESRPDTIQADEAAARKVLESINYDGLAKLIAPY